MAFFNEFPHTRTYDSDLAWLIRRMKEVLSKMDRVDELMAELQNILASLPETIRAEIARQLIEYFSTAEFEQLITTAFNNINNSPMVYGNFIRESDGYSFGGSGGVGGVVVADGVFRMFRIDNMVAFNLEATQLTVNLGWNSTTRKFYIPRSFMRDNLNCDIITTPREVDSVISTRKMGDSTSSTRDFGVIKFNNENTEQNHPDSIAIELPYIRLSSSETSRTGYYDYKSTLYIPVQHIPPTP